MQEKILQQSNDINKNPKDTMPLQSIENRPIPQPNFEASTPNDTIRQKSVFHHPMPMYIPPYPVEHVQELKQNTNHSMMYLMTMPTPNRPKTPPSVTFLTPSRGNMPIMTPFQTPPVGQQAIKRQHKKTASSDAESDKSCEEDEIDVVNDKPTDSSREIDSSMSINNTSSLESPSTGSSNSSSPASNSNNSPSSADGSIKKKVRTNYTPSQVQALEKVFHENPYPEAETMEKLASDLEIAEAKIKVWFQNKRARWRRRAQENPHPGFMTPMSPMMSPMGSYGLMPHHHPMLHGSPAHVVPNPFFYPGNPIGTPGHHTASGHYFGTPSQTVPSTPGSNSSPVSSTPLTSPSTSDGQSQQSPQITSPYQHRLPHFSPYMPFSYPYGMCPPYYC